MLSSLTYRIRAGPSLSSRQAQCEFQRNIGMVLTRRTDQHSDPVQLQASYAAQSTYVGDTFV